MISWKFSQEIFWQRWNSFLKMIFQQYWIRDNAQSSSHHRNINPNGCSAKRKRLDCNSECNDWPIRMKQPFVPLQSLYSITCLEKYFWNTVLLSFLWLAGIEFFEYDFSFADLRHQLITREVGPCVLSYGPKPPDGWAQTNCTP